MIRMQKALWLLVIAAALIMIATGCNDQLRQFITPVPGPGGDPGTLAHAIVLSTNPATPSQGVAQGSTLHIDVSGDTVVGVVNVGQSPVFLGKNSNRVFILGGDATANPPVAGTVTSYIALLPTGSQVSTITLPTGSFPISGTFSSTGNFYAADVPHASPTGNANVDVISPTALANTAGFEAGTTPVAIAGNGSTTTIYVVNQGSNTVTAVSTIDNFPLATIPVGTSPVWGVMAADGVHAFIVNQGSNDVSVIDTFLNVEIARIPVGTSPNYAVYEPHLQRLYVSNTGSPFISVIKANGIDLSKQILPTLLANIPIPAPANSVAALQDGTRAYATMAACPVGTNHTRILQDIKTSCAGNQVAVVDAQALALRKVLTVGAGDVSIDAANNSSRVYVVGAQARNISIIRTSDDSVLTTVPAPLASLGCQSKIACPTTEAQVPFMVRIFP